MWKKCGGWFSAADGTMEGVGWWDKAEWDVVHLTLPSTLRPIDFTLPSSKKKWTWTLKALGTTVRNKLGRSLEGK